ncbi:unnamed protein product [Ranitomeya imitator]|uniref:MRH domain-containing protein n=1 Tax=Ranitomeya imitator TaxID=111125 RepID=A0ABN9LVL4_9NEOB|nr:unnamed protein product [Ranitomeya imitator]
MIICSSPHVSRLCDSHKTQALHACLVTVTQPLNMQLWCRTADNWERSRYPGSRCSFFDLAILGGYLFVQVPCYVFDSDYKKHDLNPLIKTSGGHLVNDWDPNSDLYINICRTIGPLPSASRTVTAGRKVKAEHSDCAFTFTLRPAVTECGKQTARDLTDTRIYPMFTLVTQGPRHRWLLESCLCDSSPATTLRFTYDHGQVISLVVIVGISEGETSTCPPRSAACLIKDGKAYDVGQPKNALASYDKDRLVLQYETDSAPDFCNGHSPTVKIIFTCPSAGTEVSGTFFII